MTPVASGEQDRPTTVNALVYAFYGLGAVVVVVAVLWLLDVVPGWVVPVVLALDGDRVRVLLARVGSFSPVVAERLSFRGSSYLSSASKLGVCRRRQLPEPR